MDSEKATAVSPGSSLSAPRRSKRGQPQPEDDQVPQKRETAETDQFSLLAPWATVRACVRTQS